jgi:hypothetical protein
MEGQKQAVEEARLEEERRKQLQQKSVLTEQQATQLASARQFNQQEIVFPGIA